MQHVACNIFSRVGQTNATLCNMVAKHTQHVACNNVARCCTNMLHPFGQGLYISLWKGWDNVLFELGSERVNCPCAPTGRRWEFVNVSLSRYGRRSHVRHRFLASYLVIMTSYERIAFRSNSRENVSMCQDTVMEMWYWFVRHRMFLAFPIYKCCRWKFLEGCL